MSRSGYIDDWEGSQEAQWALIRWRGAVTSATRGKRGQALLRDLVAALDSMPVKELIAEDLEADGQYCALGALGAQRGTDLRSIMTAGGEYGPGWGYEDADAYWGALSSELDAAEALLREIMFVNDEFWTSKPKDWPHGDEEWQRHVRERRWSAVRDWAARQIAPDRVRLPSGG